MSWSKEVTIWCDGCGQWLPGYSSIVKIARKNTHIGKGWTTIDDKDYCISCQANAKAGIPNPLDEDYEE